MSLPSILDERVAAGIEHNLKCGSCGAPATHEQCGGALVCDAHIGPGRAWVIDSKTIELHAQAVSSLVLDAARAMHSLGPRCVQGIVRSTNTTGAGVTYFGLEDEAGARIKCRGRGLSIERGAIVTVRGKLTVYGATGELQLDVTEVVS